MPPAAATARKPHAGQGTAPTTPDAAEQTTGRPAAGLTARNLQILRMISDGNMDKEIGHELHLAEGTVTAHVTTLYQRLGARNRAHAVAIGFRLGILA